MSSGDEGARPTEGEDLPTVFLDALEVDARDRKNPDLRRRWHVFLEYIRLIPDWIAEWEDAGAGGFIVDIGAQRKAPITYVEAETWAREYWQTRGCARQRDWAEDEKRALARAAALRRLHPDGGFGGLDADLHTAAWFATGFARPPEHVRAAKVRSGPPARGNSRQVANVHRALMVHFLVYAGLSATRGDAAAKQESACDAVAKQTRLNFGSVKNEWYKYRQFFPHRGDTPMFKRQYPLVRAVDSPHQGAGPVFVEKPIPILTDKDRRIVHHSWIQHHIARHWFVYDPQTGLPPPVV